MTLIKVLRRQLFYGGNVPNHQSLSFMNACPEPSHDAQRKTRCRVDRYSLSHKSLSFSTSCWVIPANKDPRCYSSGCRWSKQSWITLLCSGADPSAARELSQDFAVRVACLRMAHRGARWMLARNACRSLNTSAPAPPRLF
jgi:hypothetical protein